MPRKSLLRSPRADFYWFLRDQFDKLLLVGLIGASILLMVLRDVAVIRGRAAGYDLVAGDWLRGQTALLIGCLVGQLRVEQKSKRGD